MKRIILMVALLGALMFSPAIAGATVDPELIYPPSTEDVNVKTTICHWANGNLSEPSVSLSAVADSQDTGHGLLTLDENGSLASFVPHSDPPGHEQDAIIDIYLKHGDIEVFLYQANTLCNPAPVDAFICVDGEITILTADTQEQLNLDVSVFLEVNVGAVQVIESEDDECGTVITTTTTTTTTTVPPIVPDEPIVPVGPVTPAPVLLSAPVTAAPAPVTAPAPATDLPKTGGGMTLTLLGAGLAGVGVFIRRIFK